MSTEPVRWRPGTLSKPPTHPDHSSWNVIDLAMRNIYDQHYSLQGAFNLTQDNTQPSGVSVQAVLGTANGQHIASGNTTVTGSKANIPTGLTTVTNVVATIDNGSTALNEWVSARPSVAATAKGNIDIFVWKPTAAGDTTPVASVTARLVRWIAFGT